MENKDGKDFYCSLSKKELQELCRRYGLSPYMTKPNLVNSLYSYFKKKNFSPISQVESSSVHSASLVSPLKSGSQSDSTVLVPKDSNWNINCPGEKRKRKKQSQTINPTRAKRYNKASVLKTFKDLEYPLYDAPKKFRLTCKKRETLGSQIELGCNKNGFGFRKKSPKVSVDNNALSFAREVGPTDAPQIQITNLNHGACLAENASTSATKSSNAIPSFEFYIHSEEGVNLVVDLNSSPSDWSKRLESEVCGCHNVLDKKFGSLREELQLLGNSNNKRKSSFLWDTDSEHKMNNSHVQAEYSSCSTKGGCDPTVVNHPYVGNGSLRSSPIKSDTAAVEMSKQLEDDKELFSFSAPNSVVQNHVISGAEYGPIGRETVPFECSVINTPQMKSCSNSVVNSTPGSPESLNLLEHQNLEVGEKNCLELILQHTCTNVSPSLVHPGASSTSSMDLQSPEVVSHQTDASCSPRGNNNLLDVVDPMLSVEARDEELTYSSTCQNDISVFADEWERSKVSNGAEALESFKFTKSLEKESEDSKTEDVLKTDSPHSEGDDLNNARILRSRKHAVERFLPRRSMRLVSK